MYCRAFELRCVRIGAWILSALVSLWAIFNITICILQCTPLKDYMPGDGNSSKCVPGKFVFISTTVPNIVIDIMILALPIYNVWKLHLPRFQRVTLVSVFLMGCL